MNTLTRMGIGLGALAVAVAIGAGAYAMAGGGGDGDGRQAARDAVSRGDDGGAAPMAMCAPDVPDCVDVVVDPAGGETVRCMALIPECEPPVTDCPPDAGCDVHRIETICVATGDEKPLCRDVRCPIDFDEYAPIVEGEILPLPAEDVTGAVIDDWPLPTDIGGGIGDGAAAPECAPEPTPCVPGAADVCLPADCVVSSDGVTRCMEPHTNERDASGAGTSGSPGSVDPAPPADSAR